MGQPNHNWLIRFFFCCLAVIMCLTTFGALLGNPTQSLIVPLILTAPFLVTLFSLITPVESHPNTHRLLVRGCYLLWKGFGFIGILAFSITIVQMLLYASILYHQLLAGFMVIGLPHWIMGNYFVAALTNEIPIIEPIEAESDTI